MPILSKVMRGKFNESIHVAYGVAVDEKGEVVYASGEPILFNMYPIFV
jgi:L-asparaginase II